MLECLGHHTLVVSSGSAALAFPDERDYIGRSQKNYLLYP
jgi:hypothetical protein